MTEQEWIDLGIVGRLQHVADRVRERPTRNVRRVAAICAAVSHRGTPGWLGRIVFRLDVWWLRRHVSNAHRR